MALAQLISLYGEEDTLKLPLAAVQQAGQRSVMLIARLVERKLNTPPTSSAGRLFDTVAALTRMPGTERTTYEGQAAVELELAADGPASRGYPFRLRPKGRGWIVETGEIIRGVVEDLLAGRATGEISSRFHRTMAEVVAAGCEKIRGAGGTNMLLLGQVIKLLEGKGFQVFRHRRVPANDGGLALGQAILADRTFREEA
jgi:hydrogenase maturation protein HypF